MNHSRELMHGKQGGSVGHKLGSVVGVDLTAPTAARGGSHIYISFSGHSRSGTRESGGGFGLSLSFCLSVLSSLFPFSSLCLPGYWISEV